MRFNKKSQDGSGKCNVERTNDPTAEVFGVVFDIADREKAFLDDAEGCGHGYSEEPVRPNSDAGPIDAFMYVADQVGDDLPPYTWYKDLVLQGAREHGLPAGYLQRLEATAAIPDPEERRDARNRRFLDGAPLKTLKTFSQGKIFAYKCVPGGEIIVYPSNRQDEPQTRTALVITPFMATLVEKWIRQCKTISMGASRDNPPAGSLGQRLRQEQITPQVLSYLSAILVAEGYCRYCKDGRSVRLVFTP